MMNQLFAHFSGFNKIFFGYVKHSETFAIFFSQMFVVNFMSFSQPSEVPVVHFIKPFEPSVYQYIMDQKIANSVE